MRTKPKPKAEPRFKKGPVSADVKARIESDFLKGTTEASLSQKYERSPKVIANILQELAMRPAPVSRPQQAAKDFRLLPVRISTPNGCSFQLELFTGMDATNNTVMLEQIIRFLDEHRGPTEDKDKIKEGA